MPASLNNDHSANNNHVEIYSNIENASISVDGNIIGGSSYYMDEGTADGDGDEGTAEVYGGSASGNTVNLLKGFTEAGEVYGGIAKKDANDNTVNLQAGSISGWVKGGESDEGSATKNTVTTSDGFESAISIFGGYVESGTGSASYNTVNLQAGSISDLVHGGHSSEGSATNNQVTTSYGFENANSICGGYVESGYPASDNTVNLQAGSISSWVEGGESDEGPATNNTVTTSGDFKSANFIYGGYVYSGTGPASYNTVNLQAGTISYSVYGGCFDGGDDEEASGSATNNQVTTSGSFKSANYIYGGYVESGTGSASYNTVNLKAGVIPGIVVGGYSHEGPATNNQVTISDNAKFAMYVVGGEGADQVSYNEVNLAKGSNGQISIDGSYPLELESINLLVEQGFYPSAVGGTVTNNTVNITGGRVFILAGGLVHNTSSIASDNRVIISGNPNLEGGFIYGGVLKLKQYDSGTETISYISQGSDNNLELHTPIVCQDLLGFQHLKFYLPSNLDENTTLLTLADPNYGKIDTEEVTKRAESDDYITEDEFLALFALKEAPTNINSQLDLENSSITVTIDPTDPSTATTLTLINLTSTDRSLINYPTSATVLCGDQKLILPLTCLDNRRLIITGLDQVRGISPQAQAQLSLGSLSVLTSSADLLSNKLSSELSSKLSTTIGTQPYIASNAASLRTKTGSHVDSRGYNFNLGLAHTFKLQSSKLALIPHLSYGLGNYTAHPSTGVIGTGNTHYLSLGLAGHLSYRAYFTEASLAYGHLNYDYVAGATTLTNKTNYLSTHLGLGYNFKLPGYHNRLNLATKFFYLHQNSSDAHLASGAKTHQNGTSSKRLELSCTWHKALKATCQVYSGFAFEHEFDGKSHPSKMTVSSTAYPSLKGSSCRIELGASFKPSKNCNLAIGVAQHFGKHQGTSGNASIAWKI